MIDRNKVIRYALSQIGYKEKATNDDLDDFTANAGNGNFTKYGRDLDAIDWFYNGKKNGYDWCDQFADDCFVQSYGPELAVKLICQPLRSAGAGCEFSAMYYRNAGRWFTTPEPGDQIFFNYGSGISHTGIVVDVTDYAVVTVEGNVNGQVVRTSYPFYSSIIAGYGRPCWELYEETIPIYDADPPAAETCEVTLTLPVLKYGDKNWHVSLMQITLMGRGYSCGATGADGDFGMQTKIGLYEFQKANALDPNCVCNADTWIKLLQ